MRTLSAKIQAAVFVIATITISWTVQFLTIRQGAGQNSLWGLALMWTPGVVAIACAFLIGDGWKDLALRWPGIKPLIAAYLVPALTAILVVALLVIFRIADFEIDPKLIEKRGGLAPFLFFALGIVPTFLILIPILAGLGEELGWRGFLHSKLLVISPMRRYLVIGMVWSLWHWPLIFFSDYATSEKPWLSVILFSVVTVSLAVFMGFLRDKSNSVFPAAVMHGTHNMWVLALTPWFYKAGPLGPYFAGEAGVFCAMIYATLAIFLARKLIKLK